MHRRAATYSSTALGDPDATLDIDAGETVVCTFTNTKDAILTINKVTDPGARRRRTSTST